LQLQRDLKLHGGNRVLWCTSTPEVTTIELDFLQAGILANGEYDVTVRDHPNPHLKYIDHFRDEFKIFERFPKVKVSGNNSIFNDIREHDIVIVDIYSTVFLDAYLSGKYCFRVFPYKNSTAYLKNYTSKLIFNITSEQDVTKALVEIKQMNSDVDLRKEASHLIHMDPSGWRNILARTSNDAVKYN